MKHCALQAKLESKLNELGLDTVGNKDTLIERLLNASQQLMLQTPVIEEAQANIVETKASSCIPLFHADQEELGGSVRIKH